LRYGYGGGGLLFKKWNHWPILIGAPIPLGQLRQIWPSATPTPTTTMTTQLMTTNGEVSRARQPNHHHKKTHTNEINFDEDEDHYKGQIRRKDEVQKPKTKCLPFAAVTSHLKKRSRKRPSEQPTANEWVMRGDGKWRKRRSVSEGRAGNGGRAVSEERASSCALLSSLTL